MPVAGKYKNGLENKVGNDQQKKSYAAYVSNVKENNKKKYERK